MVPAKSQSLSKQLNWVSRPQREHLVHFYQNEDDLLTPLTDFVSSGLLNDEVCIVIATSSHLKKLNRRLDDEGVEVAIFQEQGQYIALDAAQTLSQFMVDGLPEKDCFFKLIGELMESSAQKGTAIRAYGEMVALLWKEGNKEGMLQLERLWNEIAEKHPFSLFCAYPELHFIMHHNVIEEIQECHNAHLPLGRELIA